MLDPPSSVGIHCGSHFRVCSVSFLNDCKDLFTNFFMNFTLGTGTNSCYMEDLKNVELWNEDMDEPRQVGILIVCEKRFKSGMKLV